MKQIVFSGGNMTNEIKPIEGTTRNLGLYFIIDVPEEARAIVLVLHGMMEYSDRYTRLRASLKNNGFGYAAIDLPGHGKSIFKDKIPGYWIDNGFEACADEIGEFIGQLNETQGLPVILFGHSMGSFLTKGVVAKYGSFIAGCVLSGTNDRQPGLLLLSGKISASIIIRLKGADHKSKFLHKMAFGSFNNKIKPKRTAYDWLSTDSVEVDKYIEDPLCGFNCSALMYKDLSEWLLKIYNKNSLSGIPEDLPIYIFSGCDDPVGNYGKGTSSFRNRLIESGKRNVSLRMYEGKRHECLNEINNDEVFGHINEFCNEVITVRGRNEDC
jgi:alpha-beta hydrolase superfamily lysophospholipase